MIYFLLRPHDSKNDKMSSLLFVLELLFDWLPLLLLLFVLLSPGSEGPRYERSSIGSPRLPRLSSWNGTENMLILKLSTNYVFINNLSKLIFVKISIWLHKMHPRCACLLKSNDHDNQLVSWLVRSLKTLVLLNPDIPCLFKQCRSRSVGF